MADSLSPPLHSLQGHRHYMCMECPVGKGREEVSTLGTGRGVDEQTRTPSDTQVLLGYKPPPPQPPSAPREAPALEFLGQNGQLPPLGSDLPLQGVVEVLQGERELPTPWGARQTMTTNFGAADQATYPTKQRRSLRFP